MYMLEREKERDRERDQLPEKQSQQMKYYLKKKNWWLGKL